MDGLTVLAVDDEPRALADIHRMLLASGRVGRVELARSARQALALLSNETFDALFLDIRMPEVEGLALARLLRRFDPPPAVVFVTGHPSAAAEAFEVEAIDFLVKPVPRPRLDTALRRIEERRTVTATVPEPAAHGPEMIAVDVPGGSAKRLVRLTSITVVSANGDYARIISDDGRHLVRVPLSVLEVDWEPAGFARVHRGYLVNLHRALELRSEGNGTAVILLDDGSEIPVARRHVGPLRRRLAA